MASPKKHSRAVVTVLLCLAAICIVTVLVLYGLMDRNLHALQRGAAFDFNYTIASQEGTTSPVLYSILEQAGAAQGQVTGFYSPGELELVLTASSSNQPITHIYIDKNETLFNVKQLYEALRQPIVSQYPLAAALLPEWTLGSYISQSQLAEVLGIQTSQVAMQDMAGYTLTLSRQNLVHPDYAKDGYTYYQFPSDNASKPTIVLGLPLKSMILDNTIPVDIHMEVPAHGITVTLSGTVAPSLNSIYFPTTDRMEDSDIASFVQLRQTFEQIAKLVKSTLQTIN